MAEDTIEETHNLAEQLKAAREKKNLSIGEVAEKLNLSYEQIENLEQLDKTLAEMSPFERGYLRNYAALLELDLQSFEDDFPEGVKVGSELHSVQRYSYKVGKPIMSRAWVKGFFYLLAILGLIVLLSMLNIDLDSFKPVESSSQETTISLPQLPDPIEKPTAPQE